MQNIIHIFGASGAGTSTLGKFICNQLGYFHIDTDDYYWEQTKIPYTVAKPIPERLNLIKKDIEKYKNVVISGSLVDWGDELIPLFTIAIRLVTATEIRIERLKQREKKHFGNRIELGGDMYNNHLQFLSWAASYDTGDINMRSKANHDSWQKLLHCPILTLDGNEDLLLNFQKLISLQLLDCSDNLLL